MKKKLIRLTESDLHRIVKESVRNVMNEVVLRHRPTPEMIKKPKVPSNQRWKKQYDKERFQKWLDDYRKTYTDPEYFAELLRNDFNFRQGLYDWGVEWVEELFPGNEMLRKVAEEELPKIRAQKERLKKPTAEKTKNGRISTSPWTPFFDPDMGCH